MSEIENIKTKWKRVGRIETKETTALFAEVERLETELAVRNITLLHLIETGEKYIKAQAPAPVNSLTNSLLACGREE